MKLEAFSDRISKLIASDQLGIAIKEMSSFLKQSPVLDEIIIQSAKYTNLKKQIRMQTVSLEDANIMRSNIQFALLELINEIKESYDNNPGVKQEIDRIEPPSSTGNTTNMYHYGTGDNVGGSKIELKS